MLNRYLAHWQTKNMLDNEISQEISYQPIQNNHGFRYFHHNKHIILNHHPIQSLCKKIEDNILSTTPRQSLALQHSRAGIDLKCGPFHCTTAKIQKSIHLFHSHHYLLRMVWDHNRIDCQCKIAQVIEKHSTSPGQKFVFTFFNHNQSITRVRWYSFISKPLLSPGHLGS